MNKKYIISPKNEDTSIKVLIENIDKGYELQEIQNDLTEEEILKYSGSIIIAPDIKENIDLN